MGAQTPYSDEFKQEAVQLVTEQGMRRRQMARDRGIDPQPLRRSLAAAATAAPSEPAAATAALARRRRENEQVRMERDIRKKAVGLFARMPQ